MLKVVYLEKNVGHGIARSISLEHTKNDIVALMDADDICVSNRFEQEIKALFNTGADIVGGNISEFVGTVLVYARVGNEMYQRRGGLKYFKSEAKLQKYMVDNGIIGSPRYMINVSERLVLQVLMPNKVRGYIFQKFARS